MKDLDHTGLRTWVEIDTKAIRSNFRTFRKLVSKKKKIMGVVKSNAYGHGLVPFAQELEKLGVDMLAVDSIVEAVTLRKAGIKTTILVLGYTLPEMFSNAVGRNIHLTISSVEGLSAFLSSSYAKKVPIHLKVDTGMHRQGFLLPQIEKVIAMLRDRKISPAGLYTHFAAAKDPSDRTFTSKQIGEFEVWGGAMCEAGFSFLTHAGATGGALAFPEAHFDIVRVGIGMYGAWPSNEIEKAFKKTLNIKPVLTWKTIISEVKEISVGEGVGYDLTHVTKKATRIAVCPIGYWHGYPRVLSNNSFVLVHGVQAKVLGRVSMDMIVIDVTNVPRAKMGDEVVLIGRSGKQEITAAELAHKAETSAYEILTRLNPLMKRIYR